MEWSESGLENDEVSRILKVQEEGEEMIGKHSCEMRSAKLHEIGGAVLPHADFARQCGNLVGLD